jgi:Bacterial Ig-like domain/F5/8 type C domain/LVIVD repeat
MLGRRILATAALACGAMLVLPTLGQEIIMPGPGIPKVRFTKDSLFKFFGTPKLGIPTGKAMAAATHMLNGYIVVPFGEDAELGRGGWYFFDASKLPKSMPTVRILYSTKSLREQNVICFRKDPDGKIYAAIMGIDGVQILDWTDAPRTSKELTYLKLPGERSTDYDGPWWISWQGRYMYCGGVSAGLFIVDTENPAQPVIVKTIPNSQLGNFRASSCIAVGNRLYLGEQDVGFGQSILDIGDPVNPRLLAINTDNLSMMYSQVVNGNLLLVAGRSQAFKIYDISNDSKITLLGRIPEATGMSYVHFQDGIVHAGSNGFAQTANNQGGEGYWKIDIRDPRNPKVLKHIDSHGDADGYSLLANKNYHLDWNVPVGNFIFTTDDMLFGSGVFAHAEEPDTLPAKVNMVMPRPGATNQPVTSRIGLTFTDQITPESIGPNALGIYAAGNTTQLDGYYTVAQGLVQFSPKQSLLPNTTYHIVVKKGGLRDYAGNPIDSAYESVFSTGTTVAAYTSLPAGSITAGATDAAAANPAERVTDGDLSTFWRTSGAAKPLPHDLTLAFDQAHSLGRMTYYPPQGSSLDGTITRWELWVSQDGTNFAKQDGGEWVDDANPKTVVLPSVTARAIRLRALAGRGGFAAAAEIRVERFQGLTGFAARESRATKDSQTSQNAGVEKPFGLRFRVFQKLWNLLGQQIPDQPTR